MENLESGAVEVLRIPACLRKLIGKSCDLGEETWWVGSGLIHFELGGDFEFLFFVGKGNGGEEVGGLLCAWVAGNIEGVETDGKGEGLEFEAEADAGGGVGGAEDGGGA